MRGAVIFQGELIAPGSHAYKLFHDKKWNELRAHMSDLENKKHALQGTKPKQPTGETK